MLDHGQLNPPTPAALSPTISRRTSGTKTGSMSDTHPRRLSGLSGSMTMSMGQPMSMSALDSEDDGTAPPMRDVSTPQDDGAPTPPVRRESSGAAGKVHGRGALDGLNMSMSALNTEDAPKSAPVPAEFSAEAAKIVGRRMSDALIARADAAPSTEQVASQTFASSTDLAAQLFGNPKLAGLRGMEAGGAKQSSVSPPIIANPKCSGYFVEPVSPFLSYLLICVVLTGRQMKWMEPFLQSGQLAGKIMCPNKKCGAKLGNYDWAGVCCSCKEWVTPVSRSSSSRSRCR